MKNLKATPFVLLLGIMLGVNLTISRFSIGQIPPTSLAAFRFSISGLVFLLTFLISPKLGFPKRYKVLAPRRFLGSDWVSYSHELFPGRANLSIQRSNLAAADSDTSGDNDHGSCASWVMKKSLESNSPGQSWRL